MTKNATTGRKRADLVINFNGSQVSLENALLRTAKTRAHQMVRRFLAGQYRRCEATARIMMQDRCVCVIYGLKRCGLGDVSIIHSDYPTN